MRVPGRFEDHKCTCDECNESVRLIEALSTKLDRHLIEKFNTSFMINEMPS